MTKKKQVNQYCGTKRTAKGKKIEKEKEKERKYLNSNHDEEVFLKELMEILKGLVMFLQQFSQLRCPFDSFETGTY
jgi:hypothetical protein